MIPPLGNTQISHGSQTATRGTIRVAETFVSRQGEGKLTGVESFFIRTSGCNLRCWFCDTPYASWNPAGGQQQIESLVRQALESGLGHVVLTGGEPLLPPSSVELCDQLVTAGLHLTIETAGTIDRSISCDLLSISPKFASSAPDAEQHPRWNPLHQRRRESVPVMRSLVQRSREYQLKFVVGSSSDYRELLHLVDQLGADGDDVWVMPQGTTVAELDRAAEWLKPWAEAQGFHYCDRMQIRWFGNRRGT